MKDTMFNGKYARLLCAYEKRFSNGYPCICTKKVFPAGYCDGFHNHDFPQIWYCLSGSYIHRIGQREYECAKGSVIVVHPGLFHFFQIPEDGEVELLQMDVMYDIFLDTPPEQYVNATANLFLYAFSGELGLEIPVYRELCQESQAAFEVNASWLISLGYNLHYITPKSRICEVLEALFSLPELVIPEKYREKVKWLAQMRLRPVLRLLTYLNLHYPEKIVEEDLLRVAAVCRTDLYRNLKSFTGYSCFDYLRRLRINHAATYMTRTAYSLSYISDVCGFANLPHMTRIFQKYTGQTPTKFRKGRKAWVAMNTHRKSENARY